MYEDEDGARGGPEEPRARTSTPGHELTPPSRGHRPPRTFSSSSSSSSFSALASCFTSPFTSSDFRLLDLRVSNAGGQPPGGFHAGRNERFGGAHGLRLLAGTRRVWGAREEGESSPGTP